MELEKTRLHKDLLMAISDTIGNTGDQYDKFVQQIMVYVRPGQLNATKTLYEKFGLLESWGHLKAGEYKVLKSIAEQSGNIAIKDLIVETEEKFKNLGKTGTDGSQPTKAGPSSSRTPPDNGNVRDRSDPLHRRDNKQRGYYDNTGKRGLLLILNSEENREGTEKDVTKLKKFYGKHGLGFDVNDARELFGRDLTTDEVEKVLEDVRHTLNGLTGKKYYCFVCVIMSHGNKNGFKTRDGVKSIEDIRSFFNNKNMPNFAGKPKVFFIQTCRGNKLQESHKIDNKDDDEAGANKVKDEEDAIIHVPTEADILFAYATTEGYVAYRREDIGSWFITECIDVFEDFHETDHLEDMLITVRERVAMKWTTDDNTKQMPCVWSTLSKRLMLTQDGTS